MELRHLQALVGIADTGSFSAAAEAIGTVQSNVSAHIARLERELDVPLVDRASGRLTQEGTVVVARARRMLGELEAMVADVVAMRHEIRGTVRIGMIGTTGRWLVPLLFAEVRQQHPGIQLDIAEGTSTTLEPQLVSGQLDAAVVTLPVPGEDLSATALFEEDLVLVVPSTDPLAARYGPHAGGKELPLDELASLELVLPSKSTAMRQQIDAAVGRAGVTLHAAMEIDGLRTIASLTFDGYGPAILPATAVSGHLRDRFSLLALQAFPRRRVGVAMRRWGMPSAPTRTVIDLLRQVIRETDPMPYGLHQPQAT